MFLVVVVRHGTAVGAIVVRRALQLDPFLPLPVAPPLRDLVERLAELLEISAAAVAAVADRSVFPPGLSHPLDDVGRASDAHGGGAGGGYRRSSSSSRFAPHGTRNLVVGHDQPHEFVGLAHGRIVQGRQELRTLILLLLLNHVMRFVVANVAIHRLPLLQLLGRRRALDVDLVILDSAPSNVRKSAVADAAVVILFGCSGDVGNIEGRPEQECGIVLVAGQRAVVRVNPGDRVGPESKLDQRRGSVGGLSGVISIPSPENVHELICRCGCGWS
mmetsp:Transcript_24874/g.53007  ORF Transcript_24874/g.53007 Transcript_24874/m.53007 type:complete len:274 (-) Transcript_24874:599-1420(-)